MPKRNKPKTPPLPLWRFYRYIVDPNCCRNWKFSDNDNDRDNNGKDNDNDNSDDGRDNTNDGNMPTVSNNTTWTTTRMASTTATTTVKKLNFPLNLSHVFTLKPWGPASYGGRRREQCDQMAKLDLQQWNFAQNHTNCPKSLHNFAKYEMNLKNMAKDFSICCKRGEISSNLVTLVVRENTSPAACAR